MLPPRRKKKRAKLAAFSLPQAGVRTSGNSELDLRQQKHNHCCLGWTQELTPLQRGHRQHIPPASGKHNMNHILVSPDSAKIKPLSHPAQQSAGKVLNSKNPRKLLLAASRGQSVFIEFLPPHIADNCSDLVSGEVIPGGLSWGIIPASLPQARQQGAVSAPGVDGRSCTLTASHGLQQFSSDFIIPRTFPRPCSRLPLSSTASQLFFFCKRC